MYKEFFGFDKKPFSLNPDSNFLFFGKSQKKVVSHLEDGLQNKQGIMVVTGDIGTGKSTHMHYLLERIGKNYSTALITNTYFDSLAEMLTNFLLAFAVKFEKDNAVNKLESLFKEFLTMKYRSHNKVLLIIDEAQNLSLELLENLRLLSNFSIDNQQVFQLILVGQKSLSENIKTSNFEQLNQRISIFETLSPLDRKETHQYILHRLEIAGGVKCKKVIDREACDVIYKYSGGIPKLINLIAELALFRAYEADLKKLNSALIEEVVNERKGGVLQFKYVVSFFNHEEDLWLEKLHANVPRVNNNPDQHYDVDDKTDLNTPAPMISLRKEELGASLEFTDEPSLELGLSKPIGANDISEEGVEKDNALNEDGFLYRDRVFNIDGSKLLVGVICILLGAMTFFYVAGDYSFNEKQELQVQLKDEKKLNQKIDIVQKNVDPVMAKTLEQRVKADDIELVKATISNAPLHVKPEEQEEISLPRQIKNGNETQPEKLNVLKTEPALPALEIANQEEQVSESTEIKKPMVSALNDELYNQRKTGNQLDTTVVIKKEPLNSVTETKLKISEKISVDLPKKAEHTKKVIAKLVQPSNLDLIIQNPRALPKPISSDEKINAFLAIAETYMDKLKFTTPEEKCAWNTYKKVLEIDPKQKQALDGIKKIKDIYVFWAKREVDQRNFERAEHFFIKALIVAPKNKDLHALLDLLKKNSLGMEN